MEPIQVPCPVWAADPAAAVAALREEEAVEAVLADAVAIVDEAVPATLADPTTDSTTVSATGIAATRT